MSETSRRPQVKSVSAATLVGGAVLAGSIIATILKSFKRSAEFRVESIKDVKISGEIIAPAELSTALNKKIATTGSVTPMGGASLNMSKIALLNALSETPLYIADVGAFTKQVETLISTKNIEGVAVAEKNIVKEALRGHSTVFIRTLAESVKNASAFAGFPTVESFLPLGENLVHVSTLDGAGDRALVTQIKIVDGEAMLETEVINGGNDCHSILDAFDRGLDKEGVRTGLPARKPTSGRIESAAAADFLRRMVIKKASPATLDPEARRQKQKPLAAAPKTRLRSGSR